MANEQPAPEIQTGVMLAEHCRFNVGGPADYFTAVTGGDQLARAIDYAHEKQLPYLVLAGGSNLFFDDEGFRGLVIKLSDGGWQLDEPREHVTASAGYWLGDLIRELAERGRGGLEFLANIPGSVGGAVVGNAGCYGRAIADVLTGAGIYDVEAREYLNVKPAFFEFAYRHSKLKYTTRYVVLAATLAVTERARDEVIGEVEAELAERRHKHPHEAQCAGSYFKNPGHGKPAWQVITEAGLAGARVGAACLSPLHANFLVNEGGATSAQIIELTRVIQRGVQRHANIKLIPEVRYVSPHGIVELHSGDV